MILSAFGQNSHTLADFYAHTNWVDAPDRGGCVRNALNFSWRTETGYVPIGLDQRRVWEEEYDIIPMESLYSGTVHLASNVEGCWSDITCVDDKTTHGYWNKDTADSSGGVVQYTDAETEAFEKAGMYFWEVQIYDPDAPPGTKGHPEGTFGKDWYGDYGNEKPKKGDRIYVAQFITNRYEMAYYLAVEHTKQEIARLWEAAAGVTVTGYASGPLALHTVFGMDAIELKAEEIEYTRLLPKR